MHTVVETPEYLTAAKQARMTVDERDWVVRYIASNPDAGAIIPVPKEGQGKSGGYCVVTYYLDRDTPVFLLTVLDKSKKANLSEEEKKATKMAAKTEKKQRRQ
ncbi:MAG TPA: type II toxin-antitoxin system RelE/ParE family toxin [Bryobacteraceae bacterium]